MNRWTMPDIGGLWRRLTNRKAVDGQAPRRIALSPGEYRVDPEVLDRYGHEMFDRINNARP